MHGNSIGILAVISLVLLHGTRGLPTPTDVIASGNIRHVVAESNPPSSASEENPVPAPSQLPYFALAIIQHPSPLCVPQDATDDKTKSDVEQIQSPAVVVLITSRDDKEGARPGSDEKIIPADQAGKSARHIRRASDLGLTISSAGDGSGTTTAGAAKPGETVSGSTTILEGEAAADEREAAHNAAKEAVKEALGGAEKVNVADLIASALKGRKKRARVFNEMFTQV